MNESSSREILSQLRKQVAQLEGCFDASDPAGMAVEPPAIITFGAAAIDERLPAGGIEKGALHEIAPVAYRDSTAAAGFCAALATRVLTAEGTAANHHILWCQKRDHLHDTGFLYGAGLAAFGLQPASLLLVCGKRDQDILWAMEEGLSCPQLHVVIGEVDKIDLTASRRLSLAARSRQRTALLLRFTRETGVKSGIATGSAAATRWLVAAASGAQEHSAAAPVCQPKWRVMLDRCRNGKTHNWTMEWDYEALRFRLVSPLAGRKTVSQPKTQRASGQRLRLAG